MLSAGSGCGCSVSLKTGPVEVRRAVKPKWGGGIQLVAHLVLPGDFWYWEGLEQACVCRAEQVSQQLRAGCSSEPAGSPLQQSQFVHRCGLKTPSNIFILEHLWRAVRSQSTSQTTD